MRDSANTHISRFSTRSENEGNDVCEMYRDLRDRNRERDRERERERERMSEKERKKNDMDTLAMTFTKEDVKVVKTAL